MKIAAKELKPIIKEAYSMIKIVKKREQGFSSKSYTRTEGNDTSFENYFSAEQQKNG